MKDAKEESDLRELDAEIAEHVFGLKIKWLLTLGKSEPWVIAEYPRGKAEHPVKEYTTNPADSDALDDAIIKKLGPDYLHIGQESSGTYWLSAMVGEVKIESGHPDKKVCRALFAKALFSTPTKL